MNTISIAGLGRVAIKNYTSEKLLIEQLTSYSAKNVRLLLPYALFIIRKTNNSVTKSGAIIFPNGDVIDLYSGGVLDNASEIILSSLVIQSTEYSPCDFALA